MNTQAPSPSIRYSAPADTGLQIAVEFLKVLCIILGVAATPLLLKLFANEQFATFAPWFWAVGAIMGFILVLFGGIYSLVQGRRRRQYREMYSPRQLLLDRLLPPFQIVVSTRAQPVENQAPASTDVQMQFGFLQSRLSGQVVDELLPPLGFHLFPDPLQPRYISLVTQSAYQKKLDALKIMHQTGEITDADYEEKVQSLQHTSPQHTAQKLKALQAMRDAGLMSRSAYKSRVKEIKHAASENNELAQKSWLLLPALLIAIGGFILLFALVAFLVEQRQVDSSILITFYFSSPVFLLWILTEALYAYPLVLIGKYRKGAHIVGLIKSLSQIIAAIALWVYLGLVFGFQNLDWLFYTGAALASVGLIVGVIAAVLNGRLNNQPATIPGERNDQENQIREVPDNEKLDPISHSTTPSESETNNQPALTAAIGSENPATTQASLAAPPP